MMTADEKNHVISNANEELDRQIVRLETVFPYIAGEISDEARLGSLTHWAYSNKSAAAKAATNERPRREAVAQRQDLTHVLHEAEVASRSEARREAVRARARRPNQDADYEEGRAPRKTNPGKSRGENATGENAAPKRRKLERPVTLDTGAPMERSASGTGGQRGANKDGAEKKRSRAPNPNAAAARKKYVYLLPIPWLASDHFIFRTTGASNAGSPVLAPSPLIGTFNNTPRGAASPGPNTSRPQSSRAQQNAGQTSNARQRPSSSASNRVGQANSCMFPCPRTLCLLFFPDPTSFQPNRQSPELLRASRSKPKSPFQQPATWKNLVPDPRWQEPSAKRTVRQTQSSPSPPAKAAIRRRLPPSSLHSPSPPNLAHGQHEAMTLRLSGRPRNRLCSLQSPRTKSLSTKATMRTRTRSRDTATAMRSASVRWWHATMMLVRASGSICHVWV